MQPFETWLKADLQAPVTVKRIDGNLFSGDNQGNLVGVTVTDSGEPATLSGEVRGYFIRSDGNTVIMSGTIDGNKVTVVLPSACYTVVGQFSLVIKVGQVAVGACTGYVYQSNTDSTVDPEHVIPDIDQLLTRVEALEGRATTLEGDVSAQNNTINAIEDGLAIIATGNVHPAIANGQFVYVKGHSSLAEGLYRATAAIGTNATLSTSNLTADGSGGLNALNADVATLNSNLSPLITGKTWNEYTIPTLINGSHYLVGCKYAKFGAFVHVNINVQFDSPPTNVTLWTMPSGFVPIGDVQLAASGGGSYNAKAQAVVNSEGEVKVTSVDRWVSASGIYFVVA